MVRLGRIADSRHPKTREEKLSPDEWAKGKQPFDIDRV